MTHTTAPYPRRTAGPAAVTALVLLGLPGPLGGLAELAAEGSGIYLSGFAGLLGVVLMCCARAWTGRQKLAAALVYVGAAVVVAPGLFVAYYLAWTARGCSPWDASPPATCGDQSSLEALIEVGLRAGSVLVPLAVTVWLATRLYANARRPA